MTSDRIPGPPSTPSATRCWICNSEKTHLHRPSSLPEIVTADNFRITDASYGVTAAIYVCDDCSFLYCPESQGVLSFYECMTDDVYEQTRPERTIQARAIMQQIKKLKGPGRLLDVGAGTGILVEVARDEGYLAQGVEPSEWLHRQASERGLNVTLGTLPHPELAGPYDIVTAIDVLEHVNDPMDLLRNIGAVLAPGGIGIVVTPNVSSLTARMLGKRWWHYRPAHISYFSTTTLSLALGKAGFRPVKAWRPGWYFPANYLFERVMQYVPSALRMTPPKFLSRVTVPLNLLDSLLVVFCKA